MIWNEGITDGNIWGEDYIGVTLGSALNQSLDVLQELHLYDDSREDEHEEEAESEDGSGLVKYEGATMMDIGRHIPTNERSVGGADAAPRRGSVLARAWQGTADRMRNRGLHWFEEMIENSRLERIKR